MTEELELSRQVVDHEMTEKLTSGLVSIYHPKLKIVKTQLHELTKKQDFLLSELHQENLKLSEARCSVDLNDMFKKIKLYREKLINIKQNMALLYDQSSRLKKTALKLEQQKKKEALEKVQQRRNEELLIGKPQPS